MITGSFNYKGVMWENWNTPGLDETCEEFLFDETLWDNYLYQHVVQPTRSRLGQEPSILDLVITKEEDMIENVKYLTPPWKGDHGILTFYFRCYIHQTDKERKTHCYEKGNYKRIRKDVGHTDWDSKLQCRVKDVNMQWTLIKNKVQEVIKEHIPTHKVKTGRNKNKFSINAQNREIIRNKPSLRKR